MISTIILFLARKEYMRDCERIGKENLAVPWAERVGAFLACGFWGIDFVFIVLLLQIIF